MSKGNPSIRLAVKRKIQPVRRISMKPNTGTVKTPLQLTPRAIAELSGRELDAHIERYVFNRALTPESPRWHEDIKRAIGLCERCGIDPILLPVDAALAAKTCLSKVMSECWEGRGATVMLEP